MLMIFRAAVNLFKYVWSVKHITKPGDSLTALQNQLFEEFLGALNDFVRVWMSFERIFVVFFQAIINLCKYFGRALNTNDWYPGGASGAALALNWVGSPAGTWTLIWLIKWHREGHCRFILLLFLILLVLVLFIFLLILSLSVSFSLSSSSFPLGLHFSSSNLFSRVLSSGLSSRAFCWAMLGV